MGPHPWIFRLQFGLPITRPSNATRLSRLGVTKISRAAISKLTDKTTRGRRSEIIGLDCGRGWLKVETQIKFPNCDGPSSASSAARLTP